MLVWINPMKQPTKQELLGALKALFDQYCQQMSSEFDYPNNPWTPERDDDKAAMTAKALIEKSKGH